MKKTEPILSNPMLIADCGGTKTEWWLLSPSPDGLVKRHAITPGANATVATCDEISETARQALCMIGTEVPGKICFYAAGCVGGESGRRVRDGLERVWPKSVIEIESDMLGASRALLGRSEGIACILGTGSNACLYDGERIVGSVPSLGFILGDEGSGAAIGKRIVADAIQFRMPPKMRREFFNRFPISRGEVLERVYRSPAPSAYLGGFARFLADRQDEEYGRRLLEEEFDKFFERMVLPLQGSEELPVAFTGSIAVNFHRTLERVALNRGIRLLKINGDIGKGLIEYHIG